MSAHRASLDGSKRGLREAALWVASGPFFLLILLAIRVVMLLYSIRTAQLHPGGFDDASRFHEIATLPGRPWRDFPVEYAPIEAAILRTLAGATVVQTGIRVALLAFAADLATFLALTRAWGRHAGVLYLVLGVPLLPFIYLRFDPIPTALAVVAVALVERGRERGGGIALAAAVLTKVWPIVLAPMWIIRRRHRAAGWSAAALGLGMVAWIAYGSTGSMGQVLTFRHSSGWEIESSIGDVVWLLTGGPIFYQNGAVRVGHAPPWASGLMSLALVATLAAIWLRASRWKGHVAGVPALAAVSALLVWSPLFSLQYVWWLPPWAAIAGTEPEHRRFAVLAGLASLLTIAEADTLFWGHPHTTGARAFAGAVIVLARNVVCGVIVVRYLATNPPPHGVSQEHEDRATRGSPR